MAENEQILKAKESIIAAGKTMVKTAMTVGTWGNLSCRIDEGTLAITPSGMPYENLKPENVVVTDLEGNIIDSDLSPSSELALHIAIYKEFPEAGAVVHTHSTYASVLAVCRKTLPPIIEDLAQITGGTVRCSKYAFPGTEELGRNVLVAMEGHRRAAIIANHGAVAWGSTMKEALIAAEVLEKAAKIYCIASRMGTAFPVDDEDVAAMHKFYLEKYSKLQNLE